MFHEGQFHGTLCATTCPLHASLGCYRKARVVRNHIGCAILVWVRLTQVAQETGRTIYQVKYGLFSDYLRQQLKSQTVKTLA